jgi:hypothetical protein
MTFNMPTILSMIAGVLLSNKSTDAGFRPRRVNLTSNYLVRRGLKPQAAFGLS